MHFVRIIEEPHPSKGVPCVRAAVIQKIPATRNRMASEKRVWISDHYQVRPPLEWGPKFQEQLVKAVHMADSLNQKRKQ